MSQIYVVRATLVNGQPFYCRAGRGWTQEGTEIEVLDQEDDPMVPNKMPGLPAVADPKRVGRKSFAVLKKDPRISIQAAGGDEALLASVPELEARLSASEKRADDLAAQLVDAKKINADLTAKLERAQKSLIAKSDELTFAEQRAHSAEETAGRLTLERDELLAQLEQATKPPAPPAPEGKHRSGSKKV